jgi:hypothetical protein
MSDSTTTTISNNSSFVHLNDANPVKQASLTNTNIDTCLESFISSNTLMPSSPNLLLIEKAEPSSSTSPSPLSLMPQTNQNQNNNLLRKKVLSDVISKIYVKQSTTPTPASSLNNHSNLINENENENENVNMFNNLMKQMLMLRRGDEQQQIANMNDENEADFDRYQSNSGQRKNENEEEINDEVK